MKKISLSLLINLTILTMALPATSQAADSWYLSLNSNSGSSSPLSLPDCKNDIDCLFAGYGPSMQGETVKMPNDVITIDALWKANTNFYQPTLPNTDAAARIELQKLFTLPTTAATDFNLLYGFSPTVSANCQNPNNNNSCPIQAASLVKNYNFDNYFNTLTYSDGLQQTAAANFIQFGTLQSAPVSVANIIQLLNSKTAVFDRVLANNSDLQDYLASLRLYAAIASTAKSNLDYFYQQRLPFEVTKPDGSKQTASSTIKQTLTTLKAQDPNNFSSSDPTKVSPLQLENYMSTHRLSEEWLMNLPKDSPAMLQRQMVVLQAENLAETHRLRMSIDRLTASMSLMMMQNSSTMRQQLINDNPVTNSN